MIKTETKKDRLKNIKIMPYISGSIVSLLSALALILAFAFVIRFANVSNSLITPVNIVIKIISISLGVFVATKDGTKGLVKGVVVGICFTFLCQIVFAILNRAVSLSAMIFVDFLVAAVVGMLSGILFVNLKKN